MGSSEQRFARLLLLNANGFNNVLQLPFIIFFADQLQRCSRFLDAIFFRQPARAARNAKQHQKKQGCGNRGYTEFPSPLGRSQSSSSNDVVRKICKQNTEYHVELKQTHEPAPQTRRGNLRDIHWTEHGRSADSQTTEEAERH